MSHAHNLKRKADWLKLNLIEDTIKVETDKS